VHFNRVLKVLFFFVMSTHWVGCFWWLIGSIETRNGRAELEDRGEDADDYRDSWLQRIAEMEWNGRQALSLSLDSPLSQQYTSSLYWSFTALVKVPWIAPFTVWEKAFASCVVIIGAIFFALLLGNITAAWQAFDRSNAQRREKMTLMHRFAASRKLSNELKKGMTQYVDAMFTFQGVTDGVDRLHALPYSLRGSLLCVIFKELIHSCELFRACTEQTTVLLLQTLQSQVCLPKAVLVEEHEVATHLFVLHRGSLQATLGERSAAAEEETQKAQPSKGNLKRSLRFRVIEKRGAFVGLYDPHAAHTRLPLRVVALKLSQLFAIERHDLSEVLGSSIASDRQRILEALKREEALVMEAIKANRKRVSASVTPAAAEEAHARLEPPSPEAGGAPGRRRSSAPMSSMGTLLQREPQEEADGAADGGAVASLKLSMLNAQTHARAYYLEARRVKHHAGHICGLLQALQAMPLQDRPRVGSPCGDAYLPGGAGTTASDSSVDPASIELRTTGSSSRVVARDFLNQQGALSA
jgi:hypothetical protein